MKLGARPGRGQFGCSCVRQSGFVVVVRFELTYRTSVGADTILKNTVGIYSGYFFILPNKREIVMKIKMPLTEIKNTLSVFQFFFSKNLNNVELKL